MVTLKRIAAPLVLVMALACTGPVLAAVPTVHEVYEAARSGHLNQAQQMMDEVLREKPNSAQAHYVEAEISARAGNFPRAREELARAQQLDPSGSFAKPESLAALQRELARGNNGYRSNSYPPGTYGRPVARHSSFPWGMVLLVVGGVLIVWALVSRRRPTPYGGYPQAGGIPPTAGGGYGGYGGPAGYGPAGYGPPGGGGLGSGIVGGLASGLALGAGVAAGEELVRHWVDKDGNRVEGPPPADYVPPDDNANMGGNDFGASGSSWDDGGSSFGGDSGGGGDDWT
jgi:Tetratricopeptide repeat